MMEKQLGKEGMHVEVWLQREGEKLECVDVQCTAKGGRNDGRLCM